MYYYFFTGNLLTDDCGPGRVMAHRLGGGGPSLHWRLGVTSGVSARSAMENPGI
jgi:hypothetical protein